MDALQAEEDANLRAMLARSATIELKMDRLQRATFVPRHCPCNDIDYFTIIARNIQFYAPQPAAGEAESGGAEHV